ncbi:MAG: methyltransferase domain-containing protein [Acidobacteria bacterium]|nr:methyltransferase domain-containing protein [Acidobacteriota bacterium]
MKKKIELLMLSVIVVAAVIVVVLTSGGNGRNGIDSVEAAISSSELKKEITIRNVTDEIVHFSIKSADASVSSQEVSLEIGKISHFKTAKPLFITFERAGRTDSYELDAGKPYSFRYDEDDLLQIYEGSHGREDAVDLAPYVQTPMSVVEKMLELAEVDADDLIFDIGCGDGRIVITAAKKYGARGIGIDIDPQRIRESKESAKEADVEDLVSFRMDDATKIDLSTATVVTIYLLPESNALLVPQLEELKPGSVVVSHNYTIPGWEDKEIESVEMEDIAGSHHTIFLYRR